jgi:putative ABC transport system permease protein
VATLALGIGSATAIFAVVSAVLIRPLPYPDADRLAMVWRVVRQYDFDRAPISFPDFVDWKDAATGFETLAASAGTSATLHGEGGAERVSGSRVSGDLFATLGTPLHLGRWIEPADDQPGAAPVAVLSHALWLRRFGGSEDVVGRTVRMDDTDVRVVGVAAPDFGFPGPRTEFWRPLAIDPATAPRDQNFLQLVGRLRPGVELETAEADLRAVARRVAEANPGGGTFDDLWLEPRHAFVVGDVRTTLLVLGGAVGLLFALAAVNFVNLLLVRALGRRHELAVRAALGAPSGRLLAPLLAESLLLAAVGGALGLALGAGATQVLLALEPGVLPRRAEVAIDVRVALFAAAASLACAVVCGWLPSWAAGRSAPSAALEEGSRRSGGRRSTRLQSSLVVTQVAAAVALLVGAGLLGRSFAGLLSVPVGFEPNGVLTAQVPLPPDRYGSPDDAGVFYDALMDRLRALPDVEAVGGSWALPFSPAYASSTMRPEGGGDSVLVSLVPVRGDHFRALGMTLLAGRDFGAADGPDDPAVAVVARSLAERFWPGEDPIGKRFASADSDDGAEGITVIGVVADVQRLALDEPPSLDAYLPQTQATWGRDLYLAVRTSGDPMSLVPALRAEVGALDPSLPVTGVATLPDRIADSVAAPRFRSVILAALAVAATLLAAVGLYGVLSYVTQQRRREVAVRVALGAARGRITREVLARATGPVALGLLLGVAGAAAATRALGAFLFRVQPLDPLTFAAAPTLLGLVALLAAWLPARRAASADPAGLLQRE